MTPSANPHRITYYLAYPHREVCEFILSGDNLLPTCHPTIHMQPTAAIRLGVDPLGQEVNMSEAILFAANHHATCHNNALRGADRVALSLPTFVPSESNVRQPKR